MLDTVLVTSDAMGSKMKVFGSQSSYFGGEDT